MMNKKMLTKNDVAKILTMLASDPFVFSSVGWDSMGDRGTCCTNGRLDEYENEEEAEHAERVRNLVMEAMPDKSALYQKVAEAFRSYHERHFVQYRYVVKVVSHFLEGVESTEEFEMIVQFSLQTRIRGCMNALKRLQEERKTFEEELLERVGALDQPGQSQAFLDRSRDAKGEDELDEVPWNIRNDAGQKRFREGQA